MTMVVFRYIVHDVDNHSFFGGASKDTGEAYWGKSATEDALLFDSKEQAIKRMSDDYPSEIVSKCLEIKEILVTQ